MERTMATISSPGIGSGLDIKSIVSQLVALEKKPLEALQVKAKNTETRISAMGQIQSQLARLDDALKTLKRGSTFDPMTVSSSNSAAVTGTAVFTATPAIFSLEVSQLARAQTAASSSFTAASSRPRKTPGSPSSSRAIIGPPVTRRATSGATRWRR